MANSGALPVPRERSAIDSAARSLGLQVPVLQAASDTSSDRSRDRIPAQGESAPWVVRTALCVEPRDGRLHVFMPPLPLIDDYLDLIATIEDTAAHLKMPVVIEGYTPPSRSAGSTGST